VGYGDAFPLSWPGRVVAFLTFFTGIILTSVPISVISGNFHGEYNQMKRLKAIKEAHAGQQQRGGAPPPPTPAALAARDAAAQQVAADVGGGAPPPPPANPQEQREELLTAQAHVKNTWSDPFLRSVLQVVRNSRRTLMAKLKMAELTSRERAAQDLSVLVADVCAEDAAANVLRRASQTGLA
jgi:hypothetical protein